MANLAFCSSISPCATNITSVHSTFISRSSTFLSSSNFKYTTNTRRRARNLVFTVDSNQSCHQNVPTNCQMSSPGETTKQEESQPIADNTMENTIKEDYHQSTASSTSESFWESVTSFRNIRKILIPISLFGFAETTYLTFNKLFSSPGAICGTQGCLDVLEGPFSSFMGIPITLFGQLAYAIFAYLAIWPLASSDEERPKDSKNPDAGTVLIPAEELYATRDAATRPLMLALSTAMTIFSAFLMSLLVFVIKSMCPYCVFSAVCSTTLFILTAFIGRAVPQWKPAVGISVASTTVATAAAAMLYFVSMPAQLLAQPPSEPQSPPAITMNSSSDSLRVAEKLKQKKTKMYGAYWCSHCYDQKQRFGKKAFSRIQYIECDKYGVNSQFQLCRNKRIPGYPTWEIDGELYPGEIDIPDLEKLAEDSGK